MAQQERRDRLRIATAAYPLDRVSSWQAYADKISDWVGKAAGQGAELLVFPEYGSLELTALVGADGNLAAQTDGVQCYLSDFRQLFQALARHHGLYILCPSFLVRDSDGALRNAVWMYGPDGEIGRQDKIIPTCFERDHWNLTGGDGITMMPTPWGPVGVCICYDSEFPLLARHMAKAGARLLLVPSCTDSLAGWWRVRVGSAARALENQCITVQSPTVGEADWCPAVDENVGAAAIYGPSDTGFPDDGVIALGGIGQAGWLYADLDLALVDHVRSHGRVANFTHWSEQIRGLAEPGK